MVTLDFQTHPLLVENIALLAPAYVRMSFRLTSKHFCDLIDRSSFHHVVISCPDHFVKDLSMVMLSTADDMFILPCLEAVQKTTRASPMLLWNCIKVVEIAGLPFPCPKSTLDQLGKLLSTLRPKFVLDYSCSPSDMLPSVDTMFADVEGGVTSKVRKLVLSHLGYSWNSPISKTNSMTAEVVVLIWADDDGLSNAFRSNPLLQHIIPPDDEGLKPRYQLCIDTIFCMLSHMAPKSVVVVNAGPAEALLRRSFAQDMESDGKWTFVTLEDYLAALDREEDELTRRTLATRAAVLQTTVLEEMFSSWTESSDEDMDETGEDIDSLDHENMDNTNGSNTED